MTVPGWGVDSARQLVYGQLAIYITAALAAANWREASPGSSAACNINFSPVPAWNLALMQSLVCSAVFRPSKQQTWWIYLKNTPPPPWDIRGYHKGCVGCVHVCMCTLIDPRDWSQLDTGPNIQIYASNIGSNMYEPGVLTWSGRRLPATAAQCLAVPEYTHVEMLHLAACHASGSSHYVGLEQMNINWDI